MYDIVYSQKAEEDLAKLRHSEPAAYKGCETAQRTDVASSFWYRSSRTVEGWPYWSVEPNHYQEASADLRNLRNRSLCWRALCLRPLWGQIISPLCHLLYFSPNKIPFWLAQAGLPKSPKITQSSLFAFSDKNKTRGVWLREFMVTEMRKVAIRCVLSYHNPTL